MRKIPALCLALAAFFYASAAYSRICFLGDLDCQLGRFEAAEGVPCAEQGGDWVYEYDRCSQLVYGAPVCNDSTGNYYAPGTCPTGYTDMYSLSNQDKYICTSSTFGESCGVKCCKGSSATDEEGDIMCEADYVVCSNNSVGVGDSCTDKDGTKYKECICESTQYPYTCSETGLTANNSYDSCMDSSGNLYYAQCQCASGYTLTDTVTCENNCACDGTIIKPAPQLPGTNQYCWQGCRCNDDCEVNQCLIDFQSDFDTYWGGYDVNTKCNNLTIDCATLGYNSGRAGTGTTCKDGTEPYRCPFDHTQVYCESGLESSCEFTEKTECETAYFNSVCSIDGAGCYNPTACRTGYGKTVEVCSAGDAGNWSLGSTDEYGCARCLCETTCIDKVTPPANAEPVYEPCSACGSSTQIIIDFTCPTGYVKSSDGTSCEKVGCQDGYGKTVEECGNAGGWTLGTLDSSGCGKCTPKTCPVVSVNVGTGTSSGSGDIQKIQSTTDADVENCGTYGSQGWTISPTSNFAGNDRCYVCKPKTCPTGYKKGLSSVNSCGDTGSEGWDFEVAGTAAGEVTCGKCTAKQCQSGKSEHTYDINSASYRFYITFTPNGYYTGDARCGTFALNKTEFCEDYKRNIENRCDWMYETEVGNLHTYCIREPNSYYCREYKDCINEIKVDWEAANFEQFEGYAGSMCSTCTGVFGSSEEDDYACL